MCPSMVQLLYKSTFDEVTYATRISESNGIELATQKLIAAQTRDPNQLKLRFPPPPPPPPPTNMRFDYS